ncbi:MAG: gamma-glutamyl-gamma-aminobutyrate hydrolase family protein, partial [Planctomycetes bacterium]|nr:gamma-glutamyl-gamma-aminobutyrate hydrolase family protein [Planctomycetota bacterium]
MRPWIAIVGELVQAERAEVRLSLRYAAAIERAGGQPFVVPYTSREALDELVGRADGLVFSGGDDFDTARLGLGPTHPAAKPVPTQKQDFDLALAQSAIERGLPTLGICYGMQLLALAGGGTLHQHLPDDRPGCQPHSGGVRHGVRVLASTKLRATLGVPTLEVVSRHHQAVATIGPGWQVSGVDSEDLIEAIERTDHPFALGVQWHPELSSEPEHARLFTE